MRAFYFGMLLAISSVQAANEPPLPLWSTDERKAYEEAGGVIRSLLLTEEPLVPKAEAAPASPPLEVDQPKADEVATEPLRSWEIPEKFLTPYFAERPKEFLIDPQGLLSTKDFNDRLAFLTYHAADSSIDFYVYVFGGDQEIPGEVRAEETVERLFSSGRPAAIVFYFLGAPQRSAIYLSPSLTEGVPAAEQRRALQSSVMSAFNKLNFPEQLEAFCVQMSIRIYWMERMIGGTHEAEDRPQVAARPLLAKKAPGVLDAWKAKAIGWFETWWTALAIGTGSAFLIAALGMWMKARVRLRFPDLEVEPRLGGAHAAGVGAVISFASASLPPASQKDQVPDYLRRA